MRDIHCPKDIGFKNTFSGKDCEKEQYYNNCYHCWSTALAKGKAHWIPVTEKLPDEKDYCLCCDKDGYITIGFISQWSKEWCFDDESDIDVIAWMPLPAPFKSQESEVNDEG